jgi:hypothetical protein
LEKEPDYVVGVLVGVLFSDEHGRLHLCTNIPEPVKNFATIRGDCARPLDPLAGCTQPPSAALAQLARRAVCALDARMDVLKSVEALRESKARQASRRLS